MEDHVLGSETGSVHFHKNKDVYGHTGGVLEPATERRALKPAVILP